MKKENRTTNTEVSLRTAYEAVMANVYDMGGGRKLANIPCELLSVAAEEYQREEKARGVAKLVKQWDENRCDPLIVSVRDGKFWVVDGQHRLAAARIYGNRNVQCIIRNMTVKEEAIAFADQNVNEQKVSVYAKLRAKAFAGISPYKDIMTICAYKNVKLVDSTKPAPGECGSASSLLRVFNKSGEDGFLWVLDTIREIGWSVSRNGYSGDVINALGSVYNKRFCGDMEYVQMQIKKKVGGDSPSVTISKAHTYFPGRGSKTALAEYFIRE